MDAQIFGIEQLDKNLKLLEKAIAKKVIRKGLRQAAKPMAEVAERVAPKDTGQLADAIKVKAIKRSRKTFGVKVEMGEANFKGDQFYGAFQEYGWDAGKRGSDNRRHIEGKGFMRYAFDTTKDESKDIALDVIKEGIKEEVAKMDAKEALREVGFAR